jgi:hypothetical protein
MAKAKTIEPIEPIEKPYTFRRLSSADVFPMMRIIGAIGLNEFTACFEKDGIQKLIANAAKEETEISSIVGVSVILEIANVICGNLPKCETYIYQLLSQTSNLSVDEIKELDMVVFLEMVIDFIKKDEFKDFIKVASKLLK